MPLYLFKCVRCGAEKAVSLAVAERDERSVWCDAADCKPTRPGGVCRMVRQATAPNFVLVGSGFHKNDYPSGKS